mmetsp:Transcript_35500/g.95249  ORF Transcript_35500/g.95249 Transcript_35500/m.95249 type:complete len:395 (-) Transcript_35500:347-1531(-)
MKFTFLIFFSLWALAIVADEFAFFDAVIEGDGAAVSELIAADAVELDYADENGHTPLILAVRGGHLEVVGLLLDAGADIELASDYPADVDCPLSAAAGRGDMPMLELLLGRGAKLEGSGRDGRTALMTAAAKGQVAAVRKLVSMGAVVDAPKVDGTTALFWAAYAGHADVVVTLINAGADIHRQERVDGSTPLHFACQQPSNGTTETVQHLLSAGSDPMSRTGVMGPRDASGKPVPDPPREELHGGRTPLMIAAHEGSTDAIAVLIGLLTFGQDEIDAMDVSGQTALSFAAGNNQVSRRAPQYSALRALVPSQLTHAHHAHARTWLVLRRSRSWTSLSPRGLAPSCRAWTAVLRSTSPRSTATSTRPGACVMQAREWTSSPRSQTARVWATPLC